MATWRQLIRKVFGAREVEPTVVEDAAPAPVTVNAAAIEVIPTLFVEPTRVVLPAVDDIGVSPEATALQAAIASAPDDAASQLVLADLLLGADDPRGELIVLHQRETTEGLQDPEALERYLLLGAYYSFPRALPEDPILPFVGSPASPVHFRVMHAGHDYDVTYRGGRFVLEVDGRAVLVRRLALATRNAWRESETARVLRPLSDAIRAGTPLSALQLPFTKHPLPVYDGGPVRCYRVPDEFTRAHGLAPNELGLAARDYESWIDVWRRLSRARSAA